MARTMKLWAMDAVGRENLRLATAPIPQPGHGEVLVKVAAVSLNYRDKLVIDSGAGLTLAFPFTPASDMAGTIEAVGPGVRRFTPGDRVISVFAPDWIDGAPVGTVASDALGTLGGLYSGVLAEYIAFPAAWLTRAPASLDDAEASTLPVAALTAWFALVERGRIKAGESVLVQGTGGVALFGLQIAKAHGARVIVISGSAEKLAKAKALGADDGIDRLAEDWVAAGRRLTGGRGVDHILELVGGVNFGRSLEAVATGGRISFIGVLEGYEFSGSFANFGRKRITVEGIGVGHRRAQEDLVRAIDTIKLKPVIEARFGFADLPAALARLDRGPFGKIVVTVG